MKEYIEVAIVFAVLACGTSLAKKVHDQLREAALTKSAQGLPSLTGFTESLQTLKR